MKGKKILFVLRDAAFFYYHRTTIEALLRRGCRVHVLADQRWSDADGFAKLQACAEEHANVTYGIARQRTDAWRPILFFAREILTYRRYLVVRKNRQSAYYENRWYGYLPQSAQRLFRRRWARILLKTVFARLLLQTIERLAPAAREIAADIRAAAPDLVLVTPANMRFSSADLEYLKAAKQLGITTVVPVHSWDNLTTKGLIHIHPDFLFCWNEIQIEEAVEHQDFPAERTRITGAPVFDGWFAKHAASMSRESFCRVHGLRPEDPIIIYLGSSKNMAEDETWLVETVRAALDASSDARLQKTQIVIRPHPANWRIYERLQLHDVRVIPNEGTLPDGPASLQLFYDTLAVAVAAIDGANTTAIIDAIVAGCPGVAILTEQYRATQIETKHFNQLVSANALYLAHGATELPMILTRLLNGHDERREARATFISRFIRPGGVEIASGERAAEEIEKIFREHMRAAS